MLWNSLLQTYDVHYGREADDLQSGRCNVVVVISFSVYISVYYYIHLKGAIYQKGKKMLWNSSEKKNKYITLHVRACARACICP